MLTANYEDSGSNSENLQLPITIKLYKKHKAFGVLCSNFGNLHKIWNGLKKK